ncbi:TauD/TfdA family dioxygenase [Coleofasciculus sp. G2-EDA-02]|uniref:TauD/TfdA family dioxygenase n=1 Tax=Coleofasciculus sp. G2-EDA-02 TaxID=3069529 RepID=UPI0032FE41BA
MLETPNLIINKQFLTIQGKRFHYVWLRDHCLCPKCYDPSSRQKMSDLSDFVLDPQPFSVNLQDDRLVINWDEYSSHQSVFPLSWLLERAYDPKPKPESLCQQILWDRAWFDTHKIEWSEYCGDSQKTRKILTEHLSKLGLAVLRNVAIEDLEALLLSIGPIYEFAKFGNFSTVKPVPSSSNLSSDLSMSSEGSALSLHTDFTYLNAPPLVQALYCVKNDASGGESIVVDGFKLVADFGKKYPDYFHVLANIPVKFKQFIERWNYLFSRTSPIVKLNDQSQVAAICFSHKNIHIDLPYKKIDIFYQAYDSFLKYLNNPGYRYYYRLQKGDCLLVNNFRVLHGRKAFDSRSGTRHLEITFIEWDYFQGQKRFDAASNY